MQLEGAGCLLIIQLVLTPPTKHRAALKFCTSLIKDLDFETVQCKSKGFHCRNLCNCIIKKHIWKVYSICKFKGQNPNKLGFAVMFHQRFFSQPQLLQF